MVQWPDANVGMATGSASGVVVLDIDGPAGEKALAAIGHIDATAKQRTPSGGFHLLYAYAGTDVRNSAKKIGPELDVRGEGGYILLSPSVLGDGGSYEWEIPPSEIVAVPSRLADLLSADTTRSPDRDSDGAIVVPQGARNVDLTSIVGKLRYAGFENPDLEDAARVWTNRHHDPPLSDDEVRSVALSIDGRETAVDKELLRLRTRKEAERLFRAERGLNARVVELPPLEQTGADDLAKEVVEPQYSIDRLLTHGGNAVPLAQYKTGKTTLVLNLAKALTDDELFLDEFETEPLTGTVAIFNYELTEAMRRRWMQAMDFRHPERLIPPIDIRGVRAPFWDGEYRKRLTDYLAAKEVEWWILDTAQRASSGLVADWNSNDQVDEFLSLLDEIKSGSGIKNLVLTHHQGRQQFEQDQEHGRGATRLEDWADAIWYLTKFGKGKRSLRAIGRDVELDAIALDFDSHDHTTYATGRTRDEERVDEGVRAIVELLSKLNLDGATPSTEQFKKHWSGNRNQQYACFKAALSKGLISQTSDGTKKVCAVTESGKKYLRTVTL